MWRKMKWNVGGNVKHTALLLRVIEITFYQHTSSNANSPVNLLYVCNLQWYSTCPHCLTWPLWVRRNEGGDGTAAVSISLWTQPPVETSNVQSVRRPTSGIAASTGIWSTSAVRRPVSNARTACTQGNTGRTCTRTSRAIIAIGRYTLWTLNRGETVDAVRPRPQILPLFLSISISISISLSLSLSLSRINHPSKRDASHLAP